MSLTNLPDIQFCDYDASAVEQFVISAYEAIAGTTLYPGDPVRLFLEGLAYVISQQRYVIDWSAKQNLLAYSTGDYLDHLGVLTDTLRLAARPARTTLRFSLAEPLAWAVVIPSGTRCATVTGPDAVSFATQAVAEIPAGEVHVDVAAVCTVDGAAGNGLLPGQVSRMVDVVPHVQSCVNVTTTLGGADVETDANLRERIQLAPEKYTVAGPVGAYRWHAISAHQDIVDVAVYSPEPGMVDVRPLLVGGELPGEEILGLVRAALDPERVVPLCDSVTVLQPEPAEYEVELTYYVLRSNAAWVNDIQSRVAAAVETYRMWQRNAMGRDITPTKLISLVEQAGAKRVELASPATHRVLQPWQVAQDTSVTVHYGGFEDA